MTKSYDPISQVSLSQEFKRITIFSFILCDQLKGAFQCGWCSYHLRLQDKVQTTYLYCHGLYFLSRLLSTQHHTRRPHHPPPIHCDRAYFRPSPWTTMQLHSKLSNSLCWEHFPLLFYFSFTPHPSSSPNTLALSALSYFILLLQICIEYFCALPWPWYSVSSYI